MESIEDINTRLKDRFGTEISLGNPNYRIINTRGLTEHRYSTFRDHDESGNFIREVSEVREVEKYPFYEDSWVLEKLVPNLGNSELIAKVSYEPLWVFGQAGSDRHPIWRAVEMLVNASKFVDRIKKSPSDIKDEEIAQFERERIICKQMLQNDSPYLATALKDGYAVTVASDHLQPAIKG